MKVTSFLRHPSKSIHHSTGYPKKSIKNFFSYAKEEFWSQLSIQLLYSVNVYWCYLGTRNLLDSVHYMTINHFDFEEIYFHVIHLMCLLRRAFLWLWFFFLSQNKLEQLVTIYFLDYLLIQTPREFENWGKCMWESLRQQSDG